MSGNPFAGVQRPDAVREVGAALLLLLALALPWDYASSATDHAVVVLAALVSLAALVLPYVHRSGALPGVTPAALRLVLLASAAPFLLVVLTQVVQDAVGEAGNGDGGVGSAAWVGLAGAVLAAGPREWELHGPGAGAQARLWRGLTLGLLGAAASMAFGRLGFGVVQLIDYGRFGDPLDLLGVAFLVLLPLVELAVVGALVRTVLGRSASSRWVALASVGVATAVLVVAGLSDSAFLSVETVQLPFVGASFLLAAGAALATAASARSVRPQPAPGTLLAALRTAFAVVVAAQLVDLVLAVVSLVDGAGVSVVVVTAIVCAVLAAAVATVARQLVLAGPDRAHLVAVGAAAVLVLLGTVSLAVGVEGGQRVSLLAAMTTVGLPLAVAVLSGALAVARADTPRVDETDPGDDPVRDLARDPGTPAQVLADLAQARPDLRAVIAANPSTYPGLLGWLAALGDPVVDAALRGRTTP